MSSYLEHSLEIRCGITSPNKHLNIKKEELHAMSTQRLSSGLLEIPHVWCDNMARCKCLLNSSYPICSKGGRGGSSSSGDGRRKERQLKTEWETDTNTTGGRGELGWKDNREQSEINLDTPDGLKFAYVCESTSLCVSFCYSLPIHVMLCMAIYVFYCVLW